jgi:acetyltransferase
MMPTAVDRNYTHAPPRYPAHLIASRHLPDGTSIVIRPIRPDDDAIERAFIRALSRDSAYNRLLSARKLTPDEIRHLTRIDYEQEMAFIAVTVVGGQTRLLGVARYVRDNDAEGAEFAIVVADAWQRRGIGTVLLSTLLRHARSTGIARMHGITLATNQAVQNLARKLGFVQAHDPQDATVRHVEKTLPIGITPAAVGASAGNPGAAAANDEGPVPGDALRSTESAAR